MKLFVHDKVNRTKIYLGVIAPTRAELSRLIGSTWFSMNGFQYHVHEVVAESDDNNTTAGAIVGGLIGLLAGPAGVIIGGLLGGALGNESDKSEIAKISRFNNSTING